MQGVAICMLGIHVQTLLVRKDTAEHIFVMPSSLTGAASCVVGSATMEVKACSANVQ